MFLCRVSGCGHVPRLPASESLHFSAVYCNDAPVQTEPPPVLASCVESEDDGIVTNWQSCDVSLLGSDAGAEANQALSATGPAGDVVQAVAGLPSEVFLELNGALTALLPSPRRHNARRRQPSIRERHACRVDVQARGRRRRRRRCSRERGTVRGDGSSGENKNRGNTTGGTSASSTA